MRKGTLEVFLAAALALSVGTAAALQYTFTNIADSTGLLNFPFTPSVNNSGTVAFSTELDTGGSGIFTGNGGPVTVLYIDGGQVAFVRSAPSLNDSGTVAFGAELDTGEVHIVSGDGGPLTSLYDSSGEFETFGEPVLNNSGTVAFFARRDPPFATSGIFAGNGGPLTVISKSTRGLGSVVSMNDSGTVAFIALAAPGDPGAGPSVNIFTGNGGDTTRIASTFGPIRSLGDFAINDSGTVAFAAELDTDEQAVYTGNGGPLTTIADTSGPFAEFFSALINNAGIMAFGAVLDTGEQGIFTGPDVLLDKVIAPGDALFGSTMTSLLGGFSLNDRGQIAFTYELADGRLGVARADPLLNSAPEPGTLPLLVAGLLGAVWCARANRRNPCYDGGQDHHHQHLLATLRIRELLVEQRELVRFLCRHCSPRWDVLTVPARAHGPASLPVASQHQRT